MRIDDKILHALKMAVATAGGAKELASRCGVSASNISRYLSGKVRSITDDCWEKLLPVLELPSPGEAAGTINNTSKLRAFLQQEMSRCGVTSGSQLCRMAGYDSPHTMNRLLAGEINWFPDMLSAVLDALECDRERLPLEPADLELLSPAGLYRAGALLVRPVPVVDWANAASCLDMAVSDSVTMGKWDVENTVTVPVPVGSRCGTRAFRVHGVSMEPKIIDDDIVLVEPVERLEDVPDNKIVVVRFNERSAAGGEVVCKRFRRQPDETLLLTSDNPDGRIIPLSPDEIGWIGVVVKKISEM
ncbi:MAG: LexA family transcriptional regulator [Lentisphaeria bacterium]|nr:LexA family transcriptional regulator [Lentisphaeria bacterium]